MEEWKEYRLEEVGNVITGKTPKTANKEFFGGDVFFITPADLNTPYKRIKETQRTLSKEGLYSIKGSILPPKSICVSCIGNLGYIGMTTDYCASNQQINSIVVNPSFDPDFIYYVLRNHWEYFKSLEGQSTALSILNKTLFSKIVITAPQLEEQKRIADFLSSLDDKIELNRQINDNLIKLVA